VGIKRDKGKAPEFIQQMYLGKFHHFEKLWVTISYSLDVLK
jgi:hypothetical protein